MENHTELIHCHLSSYRLWTLFFIVWKVLFSKNGVLKSPLWMSKWGEAHFILGLTMVPVPETITPISPVFPNHTGGQKPGFQCSSLLGPVAGPPCHSTQYRKLELLVIHADHRLHVHHLVEQLEYYRWLRGIRFAWAQRLHRYLGAYSCGHDSFPWRILPFITAPIGGICGRAASGLLLWLIAQQHAAAPLLSQPLPWFCWWLKPLITGS